MKKLLFCLFSISLMAFSKINASAYSISESVNNNTALLKCYYSAEDDLLSWQSYVLEYSAGNPSFSAVSVDYIDLSSNDMTADIYGGVYVSDHTVICDSDVWYFCNSTLEDWASFSQAPSISIFNQSWILKGNGSGISLSENADICFYAYVGRLDGGSGSGTFDVSELLSMISANMDAVKNQSAKTYDLYRRGIIAKYRDKINICSDTEDFVSRAQNSGYSLSNSAGPVSIRNDFTNMKNDYWYLNSCSVYADVVFDVPDVGDLINLYFDFYIFAPNDEQISNNSSFSSMSDSGYISTDWETLDYIMSLYLDYEDFRSEYPEMNNQYRADVAEIVSKYVSYDAATGTGTVTDPAGLSKSINEIVYYSPEDSAMIQQLSTVIIFMAVLTTFSFCYLFRGGGKL